MPASVRVFRDAMRQMRRRDPQRQEDGFHTLLPVAGEHVDALIEAFHAETGDRGLRCWLLELIGEARSDRGFPVLTAELDSHDAELRYWAAQGLRLLDTKEARRVLWERGLGPEATGR